MRENGGSVAMVWITGRFPVVADPLWKDPEIICLPINPVGSLGLFAPKMKGNLLRDDDGNDHHEL